MDFHMKMHESEAEAEQDPCAKMPKLGPQSHHQHYDPPSPALPLFVPEPRISTTTYNNSNNLSAFSHATALSKLDPRTGTGNYFSLGQWQELELQALIYRYMLAGSAVPPELLLPIKQSLLLSHPSFHFHPALMQSGYWGRVAMDPDPGRCRRTDGKKWRCSKEVVGGHKYCDRHMHRGRNRSRKPVETPTPAAKAAPPHKAVAGGPSPSTDLLNLGQSWARSKHENKCLLQSTSEGHVLRHFIDDWPRSIHETDGSGSNTGLSISMPASDVSLKLATGEPQANWGSMGGPLAEALRSSSTSTASPTSVLHHLPRSDTSYV